MAFRFSQELLFERGENTLTRNDHSAEAHDRENLRGAHGSPAILLAGSDGPDELRAED